MKVEADLHLRQGKRSLSFLGLAIIAISASTFWLANEGTFAFPQAPTPVGAGAGGKISTFTPLVPSLMSVAQGQGAQVISGVLLGKVAVAAGYAQSLRVDISWLDPQNAGAVLNSPNAWVAFGLYYPIHTGACTGSDPATSQSIVNGSALCVARNTQASGPLTYGGEITISAQMLSGYIMENAIDPASPTTCGATGSTWCAPSGTALNQNVFFITASITTPGGIAPGQQSALTTLNFYLGAHPL